MGRRRNQGRAVNGILLLDKPTGMTSNGVLQRVKRLFNARKAGHTGSLDPLASGLLPICLGEATKVSGYLLDADKRYHVRAKLGENTTTADSEGEITESRDASHVDLAAIEAVLPDFLGDIEQIPPMYSAIKHKGQRLYDLARKGETVERKPRQVTLYEIRLLGLADGEMELDVRCSKGTYIRTLVEDIGNRLNCGAHVTWLRRTGVGPWADDALVSLEALEKGAENGPESLDTLLLPIESALTHWPEVNLTADAAFYVRQGQAVVVPHAPTEGLVRLYAAGDQFMGIGQIQDDGKVAPRRMLAAS